LIYERVFFGLTDTEWSANTNQGGGMFLEDLVKAANDLFANFWLIAIVLLPSILILGWIIKSCEG